MKRKRQKPRSTIDRALEIETQLASEKFYEELLRLRESIPVLGKEVKLKWLEIAPPEDQVFEITKQTQDKASAYIKVQQEWVTMIRRYIQLCRYLNLPVENLLQKEVEDV